MSLRFIANEPWAISEAGLQLVIAIASKDSFFADVRERALQALAGKPLENARVAYSRGDVAVIPVTGPLFRHANLMTDLSGATSYAALRKDLQVAIDDPKISAILLDIDSPGGEAKGTSELAQAIAEAGKAKPIEAYVGGSASSAAYWIASATKRITVADTAQLGSIGVIAAYRKTEDDGTIEIRSSQSPYKNLPPDTDEGRARIQARIDALAEVFIDAVARNRGVTAKDVTAKFGGGDVFIGKRSIAVGMADRIGTFESTLAAMASPVVSFGRGRVSAAEKSDPISLAEFGRMEICP